VTAIIIITTLLSSFLLETAMEVSVGEYLIDDQPGAKFSLVSGPPTAIVDLSPRATIRWPEPPGSEY
jgi:hypothetical protein